MARINVGRKSGFIQRHGVMRRESLWLGQAATVRTTGAAASTATLLTSLSAGALALRPFTVVRSRGELYLTSDQDGASEFYEMAYGECVVSDQAVAIGVTAVPTPSTDSESDLWFVYERMMGATLFATAAGFESFEGVGRSYDSKAMRKVEEGQDIIAVQETSSISFGATLASFRRSLIKLH